MLKNLFSKIIYQNTRCWLKMEINNRNYGEFFMI